MKKLLVFTLVLVLFAVVLQAQEMKYANPKPGLMSKPGFLHSSNFIQNRDSIQYSMSTPTSLITSFWDYMPGAYNGLPVKSRRDALGFTHLVYTGQRTATGTRRVFYAVLDQTGDILINNEITASQIREGYITCDIDPVDWKVFFAWHANMDADPELENRFSYDALIEDTPGLLAPPVTTVDNPYTVGTTTDNDFDWPVTLVGPSPVDGNRRVYTFSTNTVSHCVPANPAENVLIAYADFNSTQIEEGANDLDWQYTTIPTLDRWNQDPTTWRRYFQTPFVGSNGNVYLLGYRTGTLADETTGLDDSLTVFMNTNYGQGDWQMFSMYPNFEYPAPDTTGFINCRVANAGHISGSENLDGTISFPVVVSWYTPDNYWYPRNQFIQEVIFNPTTGAINLRDLYPTGIHPNNGVPVSPWDMDENNIPDTDNEGNALAFQSWPYMYWDETAVDNAMMFHYANLKITKVNEQGMKAAVWSESLKAKLYNTYPDSYPELAAYSNVPEVFIAVYPVDGPDGPQWSEPITLNSLLTPEMADMIPEWAYPGDYVEYMGLNEDNTMVGRLKLMFYDDNSWGAYAISPPVGQNSGGVMMFTTIDIAFGPGSIVGTSDPITTPLVNPITLHQNYPNPFNPQTTISYELKQSTNVELQVFNVKGQLVRKLVSEAKPAGSHSYVWDGMDENGLRVASGIYTYKVSSGKFSTSKKMILLK